jgi:cytosine/adenosine deaminase-related metal-dependent hydrolase
MKFADYVLDKPWLNPQKAFYHATLGNAVLLGLEDKIGSVETGKEADLVFVKKPEDLNSSDELLSWLVYLNHEVEILSTFTHGKELYKKDKSGGNDEIS